MSSCSPIDEVPNGGILFADLLVGEANLLPAVHGQRGRLETPVQICHGKQLVGELQPHVAGREQLTDGFPEVGRHYH